MSVVEQAPHRMSGPRVAMVQFAFLSIALLAVVATIGAVAFRHYAAREAVHDASALTSAIGRGVIRDGITPAVVAGDPKALAHLDTMVKSRVLGNPIVRVKVWTVSGRVVYSDAASLVGKRFTPDDELREAARTGDVRAEVSDLSRPENHLERGRGKLVEVYLPLTLADGSRVVLEAYHDATSIDASSSRVFGTFTPLLLALLIALAAAQLPLAWFLSRRVRSEERERERLSRRADDAREAERLRIAAELHDGVVQDLAGVAYDLHSAAGRADAAGGDDLAATLRRASTVCRDSMRALRTLLVDLYPGERRKDGLGASLEVLTRPLAERGVEVSVDVDVDDKLPHDTAEIVYRAAQEALRNVDRHAAARTASVNLHSDNGHLVLVVSDDGRGMSADDLRARHAAGHMGLALLADGVAARGGALTIESEPGAGTSVRLRLPREPARA
jgi:two-component system, NarL family, sensor kinase